MKKSLGYRIRELIAYIVLGLAVVTGVDLYRSQDMPDTVSADFTAQTLDGQMINIVELSYEEPVVVYFWAIWCGACKFVSPTINWLNKHYSVVAISGTSGSPQRVREFMDQKEYQFPNINDQNNDVFKKWGVSLTPTIFVIKNGQVESVTTGITTPPGLMARLWLAEI